MLIGYYTSKITDKGRISLPKKFRDELGNRVIVARWYEGCVVIVATKSFKDLLNRITGKARFITKDIRDTDRFILGSAFELRLDSQGRFVLPKNLKEHAKIKDEVVFMGLNDRVEIWDVKIWKERESVIKKNAEEMIEDIAKTTREDVGGEIK